MAAQSRAFRGPRPHPGGTKFWDYVFIVLIIGGIAAVLPVAALDFRFGSSQLPDWAVILGYVLFIASFAAQTWAQAVNRYFKPGVRVQEDRGQTVIDTGPYAAVRHPGYISAVPFSLGIALALGSGSAVRSRRRRCGGAARAHAARGADAARRVAGLCRLCPQRTLPLGAGRLVAGHDPRWLTLSPPLQQSLTLRSLVRLSLRWMTAIRANVFASCRYSSNSGSRSWLCFTVVLAHDSISAVCISTDGWNQIASSSRVECTLTEPMSGTILV